MILCAPTVGQKVRVLDGQEWHFHLVAEYRNSASIDYFHPGLKETLRKTSEVGYVDYDVPQGTTYWDYYEKYNRRPERRKFPTTLPGGTVLTIDRIYLRKGKDEFDSITFILHKPKGVKGPMIRFWVRLDEVNAGNLELLPLPLEK